MKSNENEPLGLPPGSIRAALTIFMVVYSGAMYAMGKGDYLPSWWDALLSAQLAAYFGTRLLANTKK
jgi:hypothetical protein